MRDDPYTTFNFVVEINGMQVGGFSEVSGLQAETEVEDFREGGVNDYVHKLAKGTKYSNVILKRGITDAIELWNWHQDVVNGKIEKKDIAVILNDVKKNEKCRWLFSSAYPVKWSGVDLNATANSVFVENVEFAHEGMKRIMQQ